MNVLILISDRTAAAKIMKTVAAPGGRALNKVYNVHKISQGVAFYTFSKLYEVYVDPVVNYEFGVGGG